MAAIFSLISFPHLFDRLGEGPDDRVDAEDSYGLGPSQDNH